MTSTQFLVHDACMMDEAHCTAAVRQEVLERKRGRQENSRHRDLPPELACVDDSACVCSSKIEGHRGVVRRRLCVSDCRNVIDLAQELWR